MGLSFKKGRKLVPKALFGRFLLIALFPLLFTQLLSSFVFVDRYVDSVTKLLAQNIVGVTGALVKLRQKQIYQEKEINAISEKHHYLSYTFFAGKKISREKNVSGWLESYLVEELDKNLKLPYRLVSVKDRFYLFIQVSDGLIQLSFLRKRLISKTLKIVFYVSILSTLLFLGLATYFLRNQIVPLKRLESATEQFGRGLLVSDINPTGAKEIRTLIKAFNTMKGRILQQVSQRVHFLASISHDLKTPLTRMKLALAVNENNEVLKSFSNDVQEMTRLVQSYLEYVQLGEAEPFEHREVSKILTESVEACRKSGGNVFLKPLPPLVLRVREQSLRRVFDNLLANANRYAHKAYVDLKVYQDKVEFYIDDDGPGIPFESRQKVLEAFVRVENSRNSQHGGVGLGLNIVNDIVAAHGGKVFLESSPQQGLRVVVRLPL